MKSPVRREIVQLLPVAAMFVTAAICWPLVPERMAVHWNLRGEADGFGGRFTGLLSLPLVALGIYGLMLVLPRFDPGRANYRNFAGAYAAIRQSITLFLITAYAVIVLSALGYRINMTTVLGLALGFLFTLLGAVMGKIRPNWFVGIRTPWTLSSKLSWTKTHRLAGWLFIAMGFFAIAWGVVPTRWMFGAMMAVDVLCLVAIVVYSYLVYRHDPIRTTPADTSPGTE